MLSIGLLILVISVFSCDNEAKVPKIKLLLGRVILSMVILGTVGIFVPDSSQIYTVMGAYAVTNNQEMAKLPDNIAKAANAYLEKMSKPETH